MSSQNLLKRFAIYLSLVEVGIGGVFHNLKIPLTGYLLSLHQIFCLARAQQVDHHKDSRLPIKILTTAAILKTFNTCR